MVLGSIAIYTVPMFLNERVLLSVIVEENGEVVYDSAKADG